jgi:hypothetical protein
LVICWFAGVGLASVRELVAAVEWEAHDRDVETSSVGAVP